MNGRDVIRKPRPLRLLTLLFSIGGASLAIGSGCASAPAASIPPSVADQLARTVNETHDSALVTDAVPFVFTEARVQEMARSFIADACPAEANAPHGVVSVDCNRRFGRAIASVLHRQYFAADTDAVQAHCRADPLTCEDARTFEVLFRHAHNEGVERSRADKLRKIEEWRAGQINEHQLEATLHFRIESDPNNRAPAGS